MQYILEVENNNKKISDIKEELITQSLHYNISDYNGNYYFRGLENCKDKRYYIFTVPTKVANIQEYLLKNVDIIILSPTFIENPIFDLRSKFHLFNDVYKTDDFVLSSCDEDETCFYLRNLTSKRLTDVDYRTVINILKDYYADIWGLDLEAGNYSIIYLYTTDRKFCKIIVEPALHFDKLNHNGKALRLINSKLS